MAPRYRVPAIYDVLEGKGTPGTWWELGWDEELVSFSARMVMDHSGEWPCPEAPAGVDDCYDPEEEPLVELGLGKVEYLEPESLFDAMSVADETLMLASDMAERLRVDRNRHVESLTAESRQALVERVRTG